MNLELDAKLCAQYPKMFVERGYSVQESCMAWGLSCGDGWYTLIERLCRLIQYHIDSVADKHDFDVKYNHALTQLKIGNDQPFLEMYGKHPEGYQQDVRNRMLNGQPREVSELVEQVVVEQVKEKFGTLRFYYRGGDEFVHGLVTMAETMSGCICEQCGAPAVTSSSNRGWINTTCNSCKEKK